MPTTDPVRRNDLARARYAKLKLLDPITLAKTKADRNKRWASRKPELIAHQHRSWMLRKKYGITVAQYEAMVVEQKNLCKVCGNPPKPGKKLVIDHDHRSGKVRNLLCDNCNLLIGHAQEDLIILEATISYLRSHDAISIRPVDVSGSQHKHDRQKLGQGFPVEG